MSELGEKLALIVGESRAGQFVKACEAVLLEASALQGDGARQPAVVRHGQGSRTAAARFLETHGLLYDGGSAPPGTYYYSTSFGIEAAKRLKEALAKRGSRTS